VLIVAESPLARAGIESLLAGTDAVVLRSVASLDEADEALSEFGAEAILVAAESAKVGALLDEIREAELSQDLPVVLVIEGEAGSATAHALHAGVRAVLPAETTSEQLLAALAAARAGLTVLAANEGARLSGGVVSPEADTLPEPLTPREREVLQGIAAGLANKQIADRLGISDHTVKFHVASILGKLGAASRTEAVSIGIRHGLVLL
jgi:DNA-binding NarL/FixJ family response regulator